MAMTFKEGVAAGLLQVRSDHFRTHLLDGDLG